MNGIKLGATDPSIAEQVAGKYLLTTKQISLISAISMDARAVARLQARSLLTDRQIGALHVKILAELSKVIGDVESKQ